MLRDPDRLDALLLDEKQIGAALHKLLALALLGLSIHGLFLGFVYQNILGDSLDLATQAFLGTRR